MQFLTLFSLKLSCTNTLLFYPVFFCRNKIEKSDDGMSLASANQGMQVSKNNSPCNDNHTENNLSWNSDSENNGKEVKYTHTRKGGSYCSIDAPGTSLSASKGDRYTNSRIVSAVVLCM